ncbi:MAG TPA: hypothetical protein VKV77_12760 [Methylovirgula sp.]|nr:hypothetical protein [Methylovirgula sp.]
MKLKLLTLAVGVLLVGAAVPAQARNFYCRTLPYGYSDYQGPNGTYDSLADLVRDVRGIPCGINCTRAAMMRWSRVVRCPG